MNILVLLFIVIAVALIAILAIRAVGGNITLIEDWKKAWKYYSTYGFLLIAGLPDLFNALIAGDYLSGDPVGEKFSFWLKLAAGGTFALRYISQVKPPPSPFDPADKSGA